MRLCRVGKIDEGFFLDADPYLAALPELIADLPPGAAAFATDDRHYDFHSEFSVKDLTVIEIRIIDGDAQLSMAIHFAFNDLPATPRLAITYSGVTDVNIATHADYHVRADWIGQQTRRLGDVQLDEILPHPHGCTHEIAMTSGSIRITCEDLVASWQAGHHVQR